MRPVALAIAVLGLAGCANLAPAPNPWLELEVDLTPAPRPLALGDWPAGETRDGGAFFTAEAMRELSILRERAEANTRVAEANAAAVDELKRAVNELTIAGLAEHEAAASRLEQLEAERRARLWEKLWLGILAALGLASNL